MKWLKRVCFSIFSLLLVGLGFEYVSSLYTEKTLPEAPGKLIDVAGNKQHILGMGQDNEAPSVVLVSGLGETCLEWSLVQPEIAKFSPVYSYDRAGLGWSKKSSLQRTSKQIAMELHELLEKANARKPYILVGHSIGGIYIRHYTKLYPEEVAGLVLVDASHEDMNERLPKSPLVNDRYSFWNFLGNYFGIVRCFYLIPSVKQLLNKMYNPFPSSIAKTYFEIQTLTRGKDTILRENNAISKSFQQLKEYDSSLENLPLVVITAGSLSNFADDIGFSKDWVEETYKQWCILQEDLVGLSQNSKHIIANKSDHFVQRHQPDLVVDAVKELVLEAYKSKN